MKKMILTCQQHAKHAGQNTQQFKVINNFLLFIPTLYVFNVFIHFYMNMSMKHAIYSSWYAFCKVISLCQVHNTVPYY